MSGKLTVIEQVSIDAPAAKIWDVLTSARYIRLWDELPDNFAESTLGPGSIIEWEGYSKLTVTTFIPDQKLEMAMYLPKVALAPSEYAIHYTYTLTPDNGSTLLDLEIGDFAPLPDGEKYLTASSEFAVTAKQKIKALSEQ